MFRAKDPDNDFTMDHYREILSKIKESHRVLSFKDAFEMGRSILGIKKFVIMRHDVEVSVSSALRLAEADMEAGIRSTFFFLQTGDYNIFEEDEAFKIQQMLEWGHDVGLHYDVGLFESMGIDPKIIIKSQIQVFEDFFDTKIYATSSHLPMRSEKTISLPGVVDVYDLLYLEEMKYLSDSTQVWREGVVTKLLDKYPQIHLLMHEYIWHPKGFDWDTLQLIELQNRFNICWGKTIQTIEKYRDGIKMRKTKDKQFQEKFMKSEHRA